ncbi:hypothetical protein QAD02_007388 [Eretmocerus hayati]|uniref:Uncharacterized protein n=1 Tax=Eretmocerus hayati TaxID=131215 RepID=A0ACC2N4V2_9HYME|nr:hypothetical protein QAD02_007388 [Eretmocerus hayati]
MPLEWRIFNIRLGTARRVIERAFGILTRKFKAFKNPLDFDLRNIDKIILTSFILHNYMLKENEFIEINRQRYGNESDDSSSSESDECDSNHECDSNCSDDSEYCSDSDEEASDDSADSSDEEVEVNSDATTSSSETSSEDKAEEDEVINIQGQRLRDVLCEYFVSPAGDVAWQWNLL